MDLNHQYFEHQLSLMRASAAKTRLAKMRHLAAAGVTAYRISNHHPALEQTQRTAGADARTTLICGLIETSGSNHEPSAQY